ESAEDKREAKATAFARMRADYEAMKAGWGFGPYDAWFARGPNNASLAAVGLYAEEVPLFKAILAEEHGDLPRFYARVRALAAMPKVERERMLAAYRTTRAASSTPGAAWGRAHAARAGLVDDVQSRQ